VSGIGVAGFPGRVPGKMPDAVRGGGAKEDAEVSNGFSRGGSGVRMRGTLDGVEKQIPIPDCQLCFAPGK